MFPLGVAPKWKGDEEVGDAGIGKDVGLAELGHGEPSASRSQLQAPDLWCLVRLAVWTQVHAGLTRDCRHASDIALQAVHVDQQTGRLQIARLHADAGPIASAGSSAPSTSARRVASSGSSGKRTSSDAMTPCAAITALSTET